MKKLLTTLISALLSISFGYVYADSASLHDSDSLDLGRQTAVQKKKVMYIDTVNTETRNMSQGCRSGYIQIGVSGMPKNPANYTIKSVNREQYIVKFDYIGTYCAFVYAEAFIYETYNPKWVTSFATPKLICAPIYTKWN